MKSSFVVSAALTIELFKVDHDRVYPSKPVTVISSMMKLVFMGCWQELTDSHHPAVFIREILKLSSCLCWPNMVAPYCFMIGLSTVRGMTTDDIMGRNRKVPLPSASWELFSTPASVTFILDTSSVLLCPAL